MELIFKYRKLLFLLVWLLPFRQEVRAQEPDSVVIDSTEVLLRMRINNQIFFRDTLFNDSFVNKMLKGTDDIRIEWDSLRTLPEYADPVMRVQQDNSWRYIVLLFIMVIIGFSRIIAPGIIGRYATAFLKPKALNDLIEDQQSEISGFSLLLAFIISLIYALPLQFILEYTHQSMTDYPSGDYALLSIFIFAYFILKLFLEAVGGRIFEAKFFATTLLYSSVFVNFFSAVILIPFYLYVLLNGWTSDPRFFWLAIAAGAGILLVVKVVRSLVQSAGSFAYPAFYLILYLCALEVAPWLLLYKLLEINLI